MITLVKGLQRLLLMLLKSLLTCQRRKWQCAHAKWMIFKAATWEANSRVAGLTTLTSLNLPLSTFHTFLM